MMNKASFRRYPARFASLAAAAVLIATGPAGTTFAAQPAAKDFRILVTNERSGTLSVIDGPSRKVIGTLALGKRPRGLKLSPDRKLLYVALSGSPIAGPGVDASKLPPPDKGADGIGVVDIATLKLVNILRGVSDPEQLAVSADGKRLYIASEDTGSAIVIDAAANKVVATFEVGQRPRFTEFSDDGALAFVSAENDGTITVADAKVHKVLRTIKLAGEQTRPVGMAISHDGKRLYTVTGRARNLLSVDIASGKVLASVEVGARPWGVALSPDGTTLFTANGSSNDVTVVDAASMKAVGRIPVGDSPWGLIVLPMRSGK